MGLTQKNHNSCSFWAENFGRSLEGQGGPTRGSKVFNTIIQMEADRLRENPQTPQQQETLQAITYGCKRLMRLLLAANNQATRRNEIIKSYLKTGFKQQPICTPLAPTRNKIIYKTACSDGPNSGSGKASQNRLRSKGPP